MTAEGKKRESGPGGSPLEGFEGEVRHLVEHTDLSLDQARELVRRYGEDRAKLLEVARTMKAEG